MTLEQLAKDISASAEAEAKATIKAAEEEAKTILAEAKARAGSIEGDASGKANKEADQIAREMVASARQANQKDILVARRAELDATLATACSKLGDASLAGRASLLKSLVKKAVLLEKERWSYARQQSIVLPCRMPQRDSQWENKLMAWVALYWNLRMEHFRSIYALTLC